MAQVDRIPWSVNKTHLILIWLSGITFIVNLFSAMSESIPDVIFVLLFFGGLLGAVTFTPHLVELQKSRLLVSQAETELESIENKLESIENIKKLIERSRNDANDAVERVEAIKEEFLGKWGTEEMTVENAKNEGYLPDSTDNKARIEDQRQ